MSKKSSFKDRNRTASQKMAERLYDIVMSGLMVKRAQNKKRFTPVNYKQRWFELTKKTLSYFDVENIEVSYYFFILFGFITLLFMLLFFFLPIFTPSPGNIVKITPTA